MIRSKFVALIATSAMLAPSLTACASTGGLGGPPRELGMSPQQLARTPTQRDVILDTVMEFDENGIAKPQRPLTATQALMAAQIEQHCLALAHERIRGQAGNVIKKATLGGILLSIATAVGSTFLPFTKPLQYAGYGGASGVGSGAFTGIITIEQARSVANSYCQLMQISLQRQAYGDGRMKNVFVVPILNGSGTRLKVDWEQITPTAKQREAIENEGNAPPPIVP